ncbi:unnamed protein product [Merluccius merluccius]
MPERLSLELAMLGDMLKGREVMTIGDVVSILQDLQRQTRSMLSENKREQLVQLSAQLEQPSVDSCCTSAGHDYSSALHHAGTPKQQKPAEGERR